jgi:hypothetical protein
MTSRFDPTPRPALRKAPDSAIHPTTQAAPNTQDAVLAGKRVPLVARVPKKLRKRARDQAKAARLTIDEFVTIAIAEELRRRSR